MISSTRSVSPKRTASSGEKIRVISSPYFVNTYLDHNTLHRKLCLKLQIAFLLQQAEIKPYSTNPLPRRRILLPPIGALAAEHQNPVIRRKQKIQPIKSLELVVQYGLGYGARPSWLLGWWLLTAFLRAVTLALASSQWQNLGFGFAAAFVPGYGITRAQSGIAEWVTAIITVLNFFLWAAFIAVFSRKYID
jgi:hypothetical protein